MMKKQTAKQSTYKRRKLKRLLRLRPVKKIIRWTINCKKWIKKHITIRKKKRQANPVTLDPIFHVPAAPKSFFTLSRVLAFITLFVGVGGIYLWFNLTSNSFINNSNDSPNEVEGRNQSESISTEPFLTPEKAVKSSILKQTVEEENKVFSMQPYAKIDAQIPLINTINPQFFIQAADNKTQKIAVLIVGLGINETLTNQILSQVPKNVSLVFSPYSQDLEDLIEFAQYEDFSVLVAAPLEDEDSVTDQGYLTLKTRVSDEENLDNLKKVTFYAKHADCIYGQGGARLLRSSKQMKPIFEYIREVNNCFVAPPDILVNRLHEVAAALQLNYVCTTIENPSIGMMPSIEALTKRTGFSIIAFDARPGIVEEIKEWIKKLEQAKLAVVPITEIIHH